jgi:hypothetical protein
MEPLAPFTKHLPLKALWLPPQEGEGVVRKGEKAFQTVSDCGRQADRPEDPDFPRWKVKQAKCISSR